jgi:hypothetical protein
MDTEVLNCNFALTLSPYMNDRYTARIICVVERGVGWGLGDLANYRTETEFLNF